MVGAAGEGKDARGKERRPRGGHRGGAPLAGGDPSGIVPADLRSIRVLIRRRFPHSNHIGILPGYTISRRLS
jgi:hypothetical protein